LLSVETGIPITVLLKEPEHHLNAMLHYVFNKKSIWDDFKKQAQNPWGELDNIIK